MPGPYASDYPASIIASATAAGKTAQRRAIEASGQGFDGQNFDRQLVGATSTITTGTMYGMMLGLASGDLPRYLYTEQVTLGSALTLAKIGLLTPAGLCVGVGDVLSTVNTGGAVGVVTADMGAQYNVAADMAAYLVMLAVGTTGPTMIRGGNQGGAVTPRSGKQRSFFTLSGQTDIVVGNTYVITGNTSPLALWAAWSAAP